MRLSLSNDETAVTSLVRLQKRLNFRVNSPPKAGQRRHNDTVVEPANIHTSTVISIPIDPSAISANSL